MSLRPQLMLLLAIIGFGNNFLLHPFAFCDGFILIDNHQRRSIITTSHAFTGSAAETNLFQLTTAHFTSQALRSFVILGIPDIFEETTETLTVDEMVTRLVHRDSNPIVVPKDALYRILRLLTTADVVCQKLIVMDTDERKIKSKSNEENVTADKILSFGLTETGILLQQSKSNAESMAPFVLHWMDEPIWNAFAELPHYMSDSVASGYPFDRANEGISASEYYSSQVASQSKTTTALDTQASSSRYRSQVAERVSSSEIPALMETIDWTRFANQTIVDIGGGYGDLMAAVVDKYNHDRGLNHPSLNITCYCLDLPTVVNGEEAPDGVTLVPGDMFEPATIPKCDLIISKHVLCDWPDDDVIRMLKSSHSVLSGQGKVMIVDAVLLDGPDASNKWQIQALIDVLLMLTGRHMDRSISQWRRLASSAGFRVEEVVSCPSSPSLNITLLSKV